MAEQVGQVFMDYDGRQMMCIQYHPPSHRFCSGGYGPYETQFRVDEPAWYDMVYLQSLLPTKVYDITPLTPVEASTLTRDQVIQLMQDQYREQQLAKQKQAVRDEISSWDQKIVADRGRIKQIEQEIVGKEQKRKELIEKLKSIQ